MEFSSTVFEETLGRLRARFGRPVELWWRTLPAVVDDLSTRWALTPVAPVGRGNTSLVIRCARADGSAAMLKLTPDPQLATAEASALRAWAPSRRAPAVLDHDSSLGALLLEAIRDENPISDRRTSVPIPEVAGLIHDLHQTGTPLMRDGVVSLSDRVEFVFQHWIERYQGAPELTQIVPRVRTGRDLARDLVADVKPPVLLHGDLHPGNVLDAGGSRGLVAIDPRPCFGEPAFDVVDWVYWNAEAVDWKARSHQLAFALGIEQDRVWAWCVAFAGMLAANQTMRGRTPEEIEPLLRLAP
jgi:streptomycin 6-kinase